MTSLKKHSYATSHGNKTESLSGDEQKSESHRFLYPNVDSDHLNHFVTALVDKFSQFH